MTPSNHPDHDGLHHRETSRGGDGNGPEEDEAAADLEKIRQRAADLASASQSIIAQALSNDSMQFLESVRQRGGQ